MVKSTLVKVERCNNSINNETTVQHYLVLATMPHPEDAQLELIREFWKLVQCLGVL